MTVLKEQTVKTYKLVIKCIYDRMEDVDICKVCDMPLKRYHNTIGTIRKRNIDISRKRGHYILVTPLAKALDKILDGSKKELQTKDKPGRLKIRATKSLWGHGW